MCVCGWDCYLPSSRPLAHKAFLGREGVVYCLLLVRAFCSSLNKSFSRFNTHTAKTKNALEKVVTNVIVDYVRLLD